jgi:hypothetical protein
VDLWKVSGGRASGKNRVKDKEAGREAVVCKKADSHRCLLPHPAPFDQKGQDPTILSASLSYPHMQRQSSPGKLLEGKAGEKSQTIQLAQIPSR